MQPAMRSRKQNVDAMAMAMAMLAIKRGERDSNGGDTCPRYRKGFCGMYLERLERLLALGRLLVDLHDVEADGLRQRPNKQRKPNQTSINHVFPAAS
jgi:hypothetical protein